VFVTRGLLSLVLICDMALLANFQPVVRNTFWDLDSENAEELPFCRPRSYSDPGVSCTDFHDKDDFSDSSTAAGTSSAGSVVGADFDLTGDDNDSSTLAHTSCAGSEVDANERESWADIMSAPPGIFAPPGRLLPSSATCCPAFGVGDVSLIKVEEQPSTVVMVRNIPGDMSRAVFLEALDAGGFSKSYDFVYVPMNFQKGVRLGYAIVNFVESTSAVAAALYLASVELGDSCLKASVSDSKQTLSDLILKYRDCAVMHSSVPSECKPVIFAEGVMVPFPEPTKVLEPPSLAKNNKKR